MTYNPRINNIETIPSGVLNGIVYRNDTGALTVNSGLTYGGYLADNRLDAPLFSFGDGPSLGAYSISTNSGTLVFNVATQSQDNAEFLLSAGAQDQYIDFFLDDQGGVYVQLQPREGSVEPIAEISAGNGFSQTDFRFVTGDNGKFIFNPYQDKVDFKFLGYLDENLFSIDAVRTYTYEVSPGIYATGNSGGSVVVGSAYTSSGVLAKVHIDSNTGGQDVLELAASGISKWLFDLDGHLLMQDDLTFYPSVDGEGQIGTSTNRFKEVHTLSGFIGTPVEQLPSSITATSDQSGTLFTNWEANAGRNIVLPTDNVVGTTFEFVARGGTISATPGASFVYIGTTGYNSDLIIPTGDSCKITLINSGIWVTTGHTAGVYWDI